jgi:hypothetical protein
VAAEASLAVAALVAAALVEAEEASNNSEITRYFLFSKCNIEIIFFIKSNNMGGSNLKNIIFLALLLAVFCILPLKTMAITDDSVPREDLALQTISDDTMMDIVFINNEKDIVIIKMIFTLGIAILLAIYCKGLFKFYVK